MPELQNVHASREPDDIPALNRAFIGLLSAASVREQGDARQQSVR
jgi:hypothetical protein